MDVTHFLEVIRKKGLFDRINTAFTYLNKDTELFKVVNVEMTDTLEEYVTLAVRKKQAQFAGLSGFSLRVTALIGSSML